MPIGWQFDHGIHAHQIFSREYPNRDRIKNDKLNVQQKMDRLDRLKHHSNHGNEHPYHDKTIEIFVYFPAKITGPDYSMDFLPQSPTGI